MKYNCFKFIWRVIRNYQASSQILSIWFKGLGSPLLFISSRCVPPGGCVDKVGGTISFDSASVDHSWCHRLGCATNLYSNRFGAQLRFHLSLSSHSALVVSCYPFSYIILLVPSQSPLFRACSSRHRILPWPPDVSLGFPVFTRHVMLLSSSHPHLVIILRFVPPGGCSGRAGGTMSSEFITVGPSWFSMLDGVSRQSTPFVGAAWELAFLFLSWGCLPSVRYWFMYAIRRYNVNACITFSVMRLPVLNASLLQ